LAILFNFFNPQSVTISKLPLLKWHEASIFQLPTQSDSTVENIVANYLQDLARQGYLVKQQGVWIQSDWAELASHQGKIPAPAASLTKIATTLASIRTWDLEHQFSTKFYAQGKILDGVLQGNLVIKGNGDPLLVWEEAIAIGNSLEKLGIKQVNGDLIVIGDLAMNFKEDSLTSAQLFKQAVNSSQWTSVIEKQYQSLSSPLPRPEIEITGQIRLEQETPPQLQWLLTHKSLKLREILKLMNVYSNNKVAEALAEKIGGGEKVAQIARELTKVSATEIQLINGSGLGVDNRISPRAACKMLMVLEERLAGTNISLADLFPVSNFGTQGTIEDRSLPSGLPVKTGTLATVSSLAGTLSTEERGPVYFAIMNYGNDIDKMRNNQDLLLTNLAQHWQVRFFKPLAANNSYFGDPNRNLINNEQLKDLRTSIN
jgi:D-alanyl-D-alanine carboxypeptidase/D-alanyl-D-alanine-endopeptidase (penicillin-binding protein 4)